MGHIKENLVRHLIFPSLARRNHPGLMTFFREYQESQFWPMEKILSHQFERLKGMVRFAYDKCPYYSKKFHQVGVTPEDLKGPADMARMPILTKDDIRQNLPELIARGVSPSSYEDNFTGGSSGSPMAFKVSKRRWASRKAMVMRHDYWSGWKLGQKIGFLWGHPAEQASQTLKGRIREFLLNSGVRLNTFDIRKVNFEIFIKDLERQNIRHLQAYSRSLLFFAEYLEETGTPPPKLDAIITTSECLSPDERRFVEKTLRCRTFDRYGCREFSVIASECGASEGMHLAAETLFVEFLVGGRPARPCETGEIVVTDLLNEAMPFIRYKIGDFGSPMDGACGCGRGLPRMQMVAGRVTDFIHTPDGRWISGVAINTYLISRMPGVRQAQILQERCDYIRFRLVPSGPGKEDAEMYLREEVPKMFGVRMNYAIDWVESIPAEASGKMRVTISECFSKHGFNGAVPSSEATGPA